ncbi:acyltransferase family protein [Pseudomonas sp. GZD-222]|uniref:acyltransferase family protein n=1 Tax=Pseudomonas sp. GZD-222 TaxID=3404805 RepID=UPI003BB5786A
MQGITTGAKRISTLDGIRGWGALFVVIYHVFVQNFPLTATSSEWLGGLLPFRGDSAVSAFFIVSGYALSVGYLRRNDLGVLARISVGRYFRLVVPIALGCAVVYLAVISGLVITPARMIAAGDLSVVTHFAFVGAFMFEPPVAGRPIPQLWTMPYELVGSFLTLLLVFLLSRRSWRFYGYFAVALVFLVVQPIYAAFVAGIILAEMRNSVGVADTHIPYSGYAFLIAAVALAFTPQTGHPVLVTVLAAVIVWSAVCSRGGQRFLEHPFSQFLGSISFPVYILHGVVIHSLGVRLNILVDGSVSAGIVVNCIVVIASVILGWAFRWSDELGISCSHLVTRILLPERFRRVSIN